MDLVSVEKQMSDVMDGLSDVVTKSDLADMMNSFVSDEDNGWLMYNTKYCSADVAYSSIYSKAKKSVYLVDNYIGIRTLVHLKNVISGVEIKVFSDNVGTSKLHNIEYKDFCIIMDRNSSFDLLKKILSHFNIPTTLYKDDELNEFNEIYLIKNIIDYLICLNKKDYKEKY